MKRRLEKRYTIFIILGVITLTGIILMCSSYALFTTNQISKSAVTIKAGTMNPTVKVNGTTTKELTVAANETKNFTVTLENLNQVSGKFLFYYTGTLPSGVKFGYLEETGKNVPPRESGVVLAKNGKNTYTLSISNPTTSNVTINLGSLGGLSSQPLSLPSNGHLIEKFPDNRNQFIKNIYQYDQKSGSSTFCVTGEESTCVEIKKAPETYKVGTIIKYQVNDTEEKYFHVVKDNKDTLTLQQRENTVSNVSWYKPSQNNTSGPNTIMTALINATKDWTNALDQTYTLGKTIFARNPYTGCIYDPEDDYSYICSINTYTWSQMTSKARIINVEELLQTGCTRRYESCPVWAYNYLTSSPDNGGTENSSDYGYWTLNAKHETKSSAFSINSFGSLEAHYVTDSNYGARAVIKISKR